MPDVRLLYAGVQSTWQPLQHQGQQLEQFDHHRTAKDEGLPGCVQVSMAADYTMQTFVTSCRLYTIPSEK